MSPKLIALFKKSIIFIVIAILLLIFLLQKDPEPEESEAMLESLEPVKAVEKLPEAVEIPTTAIVDVKGAVRKPGVFEMDTNARVHDAIQKAGGFTEEAEQNMVNLAQKVQDEMILIIPKVGEVGPEVSMVSQAVGIVSSAKAEEGKVNINTATKEELQSLSGIGPAKADAIIKHREENGLFANPEAILEVTGIGQKTFENLQDQIQAP